MRLRRDEPIWDFLEFHVSRRLEWDIVVSEHLFTGWYLSPFTEPPPRVMFAHTLGDELWQYLRDFVFQD